MAQQATMKPNKEETRQTAGHGCSYWGLHESVSRALPPTAPPLLLPPAAPLLLVPPAGAAPAPARILLQPPASWPPAPLPCRLLTPCSRPPSPSQEAGRWTSDRPCLAPWHWWLGPWLPCRPNSPPALSLSVCVIVTVIFEGISSIYTSSLLQCFYYLFTLIPIANFNF